MPLNCAEAYFGAVDPLVKGLPQQSQLAPKLAPRRPSTGNRKSLLSTRVDWAAGGSGLFVSSVREGGSTWLRLNLKDNGQLLWPFKGTVEPGITAFVRGPWHLGQRLHLTVATW